MSTMRGIAYTRYGGPEVTSIEDLPIPTPGSGEVQVKVTAGGLNPLDKLQRGGAMKQILPYTLPVVGGNEFSGTVSALGSGVSGFSVGDKVVCRVDKRTMGALAEYAVMPANLVALAPTSIPLADAAGLPLAGLTALQVLDALDVTAGDRVLITGGAGGVGLFAVQLAKIRGAHVTTTASPAGRPHVEAAGADSVVDYHKQKLSETGEKWAKIFDIVGGDSAVVDDVVPVLAEGGKIITVAGPPTPGCMDQFVTGIMGYVVNGMLWYKSRAIRNAAAVVGGSYEFLFMSPDGKQLADLVKLVDEGKLKVNVDSRYSMDEYKKAFEQLESGRSKGKVIISIA